jgi:hypothetical protein
MGHTQSHGHINLVGRLLFRQPKTAGYLNRNRRLDMPRQFRIAFVGYFLPRIAS